MNEFWVISHSLLESFQVVTEPMVCVLVTPQQTLTRFVWGLWNELFRQNFNVIPATRMISALNTTAWIFSKRRQKRSYRGQFEQDVHCIHYFLSILEFKDTKTVLNDFHNIIHACKKHSYIHTLSSILYHNGDSKIWSGNNLIPNQTNFFKCVYRTNFICSMPIHSAILLVRA